MVQLYKEDKELNARPNNDDTEENDSGFESDNWNEPWKHYEDEKYITNIDLELELQKCFEENTAWDFRSLKNLI